MLRAFTVAVALTVGLAGLAYVAMPAAAATDCGSGGRTWPSSGQVDMATTPKYQITMSFSLTDAQLCELRKAEYLEVEYALVNFKTARNWDNYTIETDLPDGRHDVDYSGTDDNTNQATPAVTAVKTASIQAGRRYHVTIAWNEPLLDVSAPPQVIFRWAPSRWYHKTNPKEAVCYPAYVKTKNPAWCIFPVSNDQVVILFKSATFKGGTADGKRTISSADSFVWDPAIPAGSSPPFVISPGYVVSPGPGNKLPIANFTYTRLVGPGNRIQFNSSSSRDPDGSIVAWTWYNGVPTFSTSPNPILSLGSATSASITLTVTDNGRATGTVTKVVSAGNRLPVIQSSGPSSGAVVGSNTPTLTAAASDDDGDPLQYFFQITGPSVDVNSGWIGSNSWTVPAHKLDPGTKYTWTVQVRDGRNGLSSVRSSTVQIAMLPTAADVVTTPSGNGYWQVASDGGVFSYGDAKFYGSVPGLGIKLTNVIGMARTPSGAGYWLVGSDGGVFSFGDAQFYGSMAGRPMNTPVVGMAVTKSGGGYWLVGADGGIFAFGDARFYGSMGGKPLNAAVTSISPTATSAGYWLAAKDGGVFAFGDAQFYGSMGGKPLNAPMVDMDVTPDGGGYWMTAEDGGVFAFGDARFYGSMAGKPLNGHIVGMSVRPTGNGYWLTGCDGGVFAFGDAQFLGSNPTYQCRGT